MQNTSISQGKIRNNYAYEGGIFYFNPVIAVIAVIVEKIISTIHDYTITDITTRAVIAVIASYIILVGGQNVR
jgi:hypothetical protein